jgi:hypothetical protein
LSRLHHTVKADDLSQLERLYHHLNQSTSSGLSRRIRTLSLGQYNLEIDVLAQQQGLSSDEADRYRQLCTERGTKILQCCTLLQKCTITDPEMALSSLETVIQHSITLSNIELSTSGATPLIFACLNQLHSLKRITLIIKAGPWTASDQDSIHLSSVEYFRFISRFRRVYCDDMMKLLGNCIFAPSCSLSLEVFNITASGALMLSSILQNNTPKHVLIEDFGLEAQSVLAEHLVKIEKVEISMQVPALELLNYKSLPRYLNISLPRRYDSDVGRQGRYFIGKLELWDTPMDTTHFISITWPGYFRNETWYGGDWKRNYQKHQNDSYQSQMAAMKDKLLEKNIVVVVNSPASQ